MRLRQLTTYRRLRGLLLRPRSRRLQVATVECLGAVPSSLAAGRRPWSRRCRIKSTWLQSARCVGVVKQLCPR